MTFELIDVFLILGMSQGLFLMFSLASIDKRNKDANNVLIATIGIAVVVLLARIGTYRFSGTWVQYVGVIIDGSIYVFGPLLYIYVRRLLFHSNPKFKLSRQHYIAWVLFLIYGVYLVIQPREQLLKWYQQGYLPVVFFMVELLGLISFGYYTWLSFQLVRKHSKGLKKELSYIPKSTTYLNVLIGVVALLTFLWLFTFLGAYIFRKQLGIFTYNNIWIAISLFIYVIGYFSLRQPEIFRVPYKSQSKERARLKPEDIKNVQKRLEYFISEEHVYLDPELTLKSLSDKLNTSSNDLSWFLNNVYHVSFSDYINKFRIQSFLEKVERREHEKKTLLALAMEVGFNSKSNFNKVFKSHVGMPPSAYIKKKNVA